MNRVVLSAVFVIAATFKVWAQNPPNIIFFIVDDFGRQDISMNDLSGIYETPNIDQMAADGMYFSNARTAHPRCTPSRGVHLECLDSKSWCIQLR